MRKGQVNIVGRSVKRLFFFFCWRLSHEEPLEFRFSGYFLIHHNNRSVSDGESVEAGVRISNSN